MSWWNKFKSPKQASDEQRFAVGVARRVKVGEAVGSDEIERARRIQIALDISDMAMEKLADEMIAARQAATKAKAEAERPAFTDAGVVLVETKPRDLFITFGPSTVRNVLRVDAVLAGNVPAPDLRTIRVHRAPGDDEAAFTHMCGLLLDFCNARVKPSKCCTIRRRGENLPGDVMGIDADNPPLAFRPDEFEIIRHPRQSEKDFAAARQQLDATLAQRSGETNMRPARMAGAGMRW